jgi:DsbC/DsbD-like thiol-disulfide interchange protein
MLLALIVIGVTRQAPTPVTELVSSVKMVAPGKPFTVALHMKLPPGWHNYYSNPGESGVPTTITWSLPAGFTAGPIQWPLPERITIDKVPMYGYQGELWLPTAITPPKTAKPGAVVVKAKAEWLLCAAECVPQSAELQLGLKVGTVSVPNPNPGLTKAMNSLPHHALPWSVAAIVSDKAVRLTVQGPFENAEGVTFFPADPESFTADAPQAKSVPHGFQILVPLSRYSTKPPVRLTGILSFPATGKAYWVDTPVVS